MAPEFYDNLKYHSSWSRLLFEFIFDKKYSLFSRIERAKRRNDETPSSPPLLRPASPVALSAETFTFDV
jgi:sphingolipid 4-desaturase/C4-monooxygenase